MARIDWRRSARDDHTYVRDLEWEAAHTVWLWADPSPSMLYKSTTATVSKESRALVLTLALAELLSRSGERIGWPGLTDPFTARNGAERLAAQLAHAVPTARSRTCRPSGAFPTSSSPATSSSRSTLRRIIEASHHPAGSRYVGSDVIASPTVKCICPFTAI